jgi:hypothetical protein
VFSALLVLASGIWYRRQVRQRLLDHALIAAIKKRDVGKVTSLLYQGADANVTDSPDEPITFRDLLDRYWNKLRGRSSAMLNNQYPSALMCVYHPVNYDMPGDTYRLCFIGLTRQP